MATGLAALEEPKMIDFIQLTAPAKMLRETAMNIDQFLRLQTVYADRENATDAAVYDAATAVLRLECRSEPVIVALANLVASLKDELPEVERAERYLVEAWGEYVPPAAGVVYKGGAL
jgi:hypothetical protein